MKKPKRKVTKKSLMQLKDLTMQGWRGILAGIILILGFVTIIICAQYGKDVLAIVVTSITTLMILVAEWYFKGSKKNLDAFLKKFKIKEEKK